MSLQKIRAYGDPRLFALNLIAEHFAHSTQPLVPERLFVTSGGGEKETGGMPGGNLFSQLLTILLSEKTGMGGVADTEALDKLAASFAAQPEQAGPQQTII